MLPHITVDALVNPVPVTPRLFDTSPEVRLVGDMLLIVGTGAGTLYLALLIALAEPSALNAVALIVSGTLTLICPVYSMDGAPARGGCPFVV